MESSKAAVTSDAELGDVDPALSFFDALEREKSHMLYYDEASPSFVRGGGPVHH